MGSNHFEFKKSKRIERLKEQLLKKDREVCSERATLITEAYKKFCNEPKMKLRAKAFRYIIENMNIFILEDELIVGHQASKQKAAPVYPEMGIGWLKEELEDLSTRSIDPFKVSEETKKEIRSIFPYWEDKSLHENIFNALPEKTKELRKKADVFAVAAHEETAFGHVILNYEEILKKGVSGVMEKIEVKLEEISVENEKDIEKQDFYEAALIVCDAICTFAKRYSDEAEQMAKETEDITRREELLKISQVCSRVPEKSARNFWEALQSVWLVQLIPQIENNASSYSPGRLDQYLYPYYYSDIESSDLKKEKAQELLDCFWLKFNEPLILYKNEAAKYAGGFPMGQNISVGGINKKREDATNELSYLCLNAQEHIQMGQPNLTVRVHRNSPQQFLKRAAEVVKLGSGMPQFMNDEICIPSMLDDGLSLKEARNYAPVGCVENNIAGGWGRENGGYLNTTKILEYTINNGICRLSGEENGLQLGYLHEYSSYEDLLEAYKKQLQFFLRHLIIENNVIDKVHAELIPSPLVSVLVPGCIEKGQEVYKGGAYYNFTGPTAVGGANTGNSLAAIKKLVFEEEILSPQKLNKALDENYEGYQEVERLVKNEAPKYGNDNDYVDQIVKTVIEFYAGEVEKYTNYRGGDFRPGLTAVTAHVGMGNNVGATPDGRRAGEALADGISPYPGTDNKGPTASAKSVAKIDFTRFGKGMIFNQTFSSSILESEKGRNKFVDFLRSYFDLGGMHIQFNTTSKKKLKKAQENPQDYRDLVVRVAGYSARFIDLNKEVQNQIIARTQHSN